MSAIERFNTLVAVGTTVRIWPGAKRGEGELAVTTEPAAMFCGNMACVRVLKLNGRHDFLALDHVEVAS